MLLYLSLVESVEDHMLNIYHSRKPFTGVQFLEVDKWDITQGFLDHKLVIDVGECSFMKVCSETFPKVLAQ